MRHARRNPLARLSAAMGLLAMAACSALPTAPASPPSGPARNGGYLGNGTRDAGSIPAAAPVRLTTGDAQGCG